MYVPPYRTVFALTRELFCFLFHKYINTKNNLLVSTKTVYSWSPYTIRYIYMGVCVCALFSEIVFFVTINMT